MESTGQPTGQAAPASLVGAPAGAAATGEQGQGAMPPTIDAGMGIKQEPAPGASRARGVKQEPDPGASPAPGIKQEQPERTPTPKRKQPEGASPEQQQDKKPKSPGQLDITSFYGRKT